MIRRARKALARGGRSFFAKALFTGRRLLVEPGLDPARDSVIISWATYSPWLRDAEFQACHAAVRTHTLVDVYRCWELWHLLGQVAGVPGDVLEVGTWRGGTGALLGRRAALLGLEAEILLCDTFTGVVKSGEADACYSDGEHAETSVPVVESLARSMGLENLAVHVGVFPEDTGAALADRGFRFCHIDVDVYQSGKDVLEWVWPRLATGGVVVFDDFGFASTTGIRKLVHEVEDLPGRVCLQNLNGHAVLVKTG
jgi:O-methyltransferase